MPACQHENFRFKALVARLSKTEGGPITNFAAEVTINCADCEMPFRFKGLQAGVSQAMPTVNADAQELRAPIEPVYVTEILGQPLVSGTA